MANYSTIRVGMSGPAEDLAAFQSQHVRPTERGARYIDFRTLILAEDAWGCTSIGYDFEIQSEAPGQIEFTFDVKGGDAAPILREIARRFPTVIGTVAAEEEGGSYAALGIMLDGTCSYDRQPWSEAVWELVHGEAY